uniref:Uncharacterized protein n=1 Tax=viral metagenome TaxID=1070528 RepID=A0A6C0HLR4_9ZZZZ
MSCGAIHDPDPMYVFERKEVHGFFWQFREVKTDEKAATDKVDK